MAKAEREKREKKEEEKKIKQRDVSKDADEMDSLDILRMALEGEKPGGMDAEDVMSIARRQPDYKGYNDLIEKHFTKDEKTLVEEMSKKGHFIETILKPLLKEDWLRRATLTTYHLTSLKNMRLLTENL